MADELKEDLEGEDFDGELGAGEDGQPSGRGRKKLLLIIGIVFLVLVGGGAAAYFSGALQPVIDMIAGSNPHEADGGEQAATSEVYYDLPEMIVNLNTPGRKTALLKIQVSLELANAKDSKQVEADQLRIVDSFQMFLRELRVEDLKGSAGMYRLREEMLARANAVAAPVAVQNVLFKEIIVQ